MRYWLGIDHGLYCWNPKTEQLRHFMHEPDEADSLSDNYVQVLEYTASGQLWIGTLNGGLNLLEEGKETFVHFRHDPGDPDSLRSNDVRDITGGQTGLDMGCNNRWCEPDT